MVKNMEWACPCEYKDMAPGDRRKYKKGEKCMIDCPVLADPNREHPCVVKPVRKPGGAKSTVTEVGGGTKHTLSGGKTYNDFDGVVKLG